MTASRREMIGGGLAAMAVAGGAQAQSSPQAQAMARAQARAPDTTPRAEALDTPALHGNTLARTFKQPPTGLVVPRIKVERASGTRELEFQPGLTLLSLWAPWCAPCLMELKDLAAQQRAYEGKRFRILPVLTSPRGDISLAEANAVLAKVGAGALPVAIDRSPDGKALFETLTRRETPNGFSLGLPCNLLVDEGGRVLGRQFGAPLKLDGAKLGPGEKPTPEMMAAARSFWIAPDGMALLGALQRGEIASPAQRPLVT